MLNKKGAACGLQRNAAHKGKGNGLDKVPRTLGEGPPLLFPRCHRPKVGPSALSGQYNYRLYSAQLARRLANSRLRREPPGPGPYDLRPVSYVICPVKGRRKGAPRRIDIQHQQRFVVRGIERIADRKHLAPQ